MFEHILTALDGSQHDTKTLAATKELAKLSGAQVRVLHVREGHFIGRAASSRARNTTMLPGLSIRPSPTWDLSE